MSGSGSDAERFWEFSLEVYGGEGVAPACLALQNRRGLNVNVLLYCCWLAGEGGAPLSGEDFARIEAALGPWHEAVIAPLRAVRDRLKAGVEGAPADAAAALRRRVLEVELDAERVEQRLLVEGRPPGAAGVPAARRARTAAANVRAYLAARRVAPDTEDRQRLSVLLARAFPQLGADAAQDLMRDLRGTSGGAD